MAPLLGRLGNNGGTTAGFGFGRRRAAQALGFQATGGTVSTPGNGYRYHTFTHPGTPVTSPYSDSFVVSTPGTVEVFCIGGGGIGNGCGGGGGGAGALIYRTSVSVTAQTYPITVGQGANWPAPGQPEAYYYQPGGASAALGFTAAGGGPGGAHTFNATYVNGQPGGSGGGAAYAQNGGGGGFSGGTATASGSGTNGSVSPPIGWGTSGGGSQGNGGGAGGSATGLVYSNFDGPLIGFPGIPSTFAVGGAINATNSPVSPNPLPGTGNGGRSGPRPVCVGAEVGAHGIVVIRYQI